MKNLKRVLAVVLTAILVMTMFTACVKTPEKEILGSWRDSTQTMGYEFKENNEYGFVAACSYPCGCCGSTYRRFGKDRTCQQPLRTADTRYIARKRDNKASRRLR